MSRRIQSHEECLKAFAKQLRQEAKSSLRVWQQLEPKEATGRRAALENVVFLLKREATAHGIPLVDLGLADYEVQELRNDA